eukprot:Blabericola_migrator_1__9190@NODE_491_length_8068_cov_85_994751_g83_i1_p3_GENE_NODE_491_length_8068_cov_85_994751_g83_i1NODE_491_length_8068_cov_85_994751_g83_i1_p3_ORF_typecomplete_len653_score59_48RRM_1/PF00076_22/2_2e02RRM_1/PF00076_22/0_00029RRM_1/PF00076_22/1_4e13RRM_occluded/PF16842_5/0_045RRM_occluded/PF16842_5/3_8Nup35_RRM_2/PF14605_6/2e03Nup35_RRM_2/PF14605_6/0_00053RRM_5/PF13893_6/64RRM_5/PF13893_6/0_012DUF4523/PF15023_6/3_1e02DUF4523/PF15023_6/1_4DUF4523/PF15023_6/1_3e02RRM_2/PF04059_
MLSDQDILSTTSGHHFNLPVTPQAAESRVACSTHRVEPAFSPSWSGKGSDLAASALPSSLTPVSEDFYSETDLHLDLNNDSASVAEADTEVAQDTHIAVGSTSSDHLRRKRSAQNIDKQDFEERLRPCGEIHEVSLFLEEAPSRMQPVNPFEPVDLPMVPHAFAHLSEPIGDGTQESLRSHTNASGYNHGGARLLAGDNVYRGPPHKRPRASVTEASSANRSVFIDPYHCQQQTSPHIAHPERGPIGEFGAISRFHPGSTTNGGVNIAPRACRRAKKRAISKTPWTGVLRQLVSSLKPESLVSLVVGACEKHHPTAEYVRSYLPNELNTRRLAIRNVPYSMTAAELREALEGTYGPVDRVAVSPKGYAAVIFQHFESAFHAAFSHPLPADPFWGASASQQGPPPEGPSTTLSVRGRQLQFKILPSNDPLWDILNSVQDHPVREDDGAGRNDGNSSSVAQVGVPRRNRASQGHGSRRRRTTELLIRELSPSTTEAALASAFAHFGDIRRVYVPTDGKGHPRGHGFVTFQKQEDALRAAQQTQRLIGDKLTFVSLAGADSIRAPPRRSTQRQSNQAQAAVVLTPQQQQQQQQQMRRRGRHRAFHTRNGKSGGSVGSGLIATAGDDMVAGETALRPDDSMEDVRAADTGDQPEGQ